MKTLGSSETKAPDKKPYKSANMIKPAVFLSPSHPKIMTAVANEKVITILYGPILSATKLGKIRPKKNAPFRIASCKVNFYAVSKFAHHIKSGWSHEVECQVLVNSLGLSEDYGSIVRIVFR